MPNLRTLLYCTAAILVMAVQSAAFAQAIISLPDNPPAGGSGGGGDTNMGVVTGCDFATGHVGPECVNIVIVNAIEVIFAFAGAICLLNIIIAGYQIALGGVTGSGDTSGKERLKWALIGFFVTACAFGIINVVIDAIA